MDLPGTTPLTRRRLIRGSLAGGVALLGAPPGCATAAPALAQAPPPTKEGLRFVHLTDPHVSDDPRAVYGFTAALRSVAALRPAPAFIVGGGDHILDTFDSGILDADAQWETYLRLLSANTNLHMYPLVGNHDIVGWADPRLSERMAGYGKALAMHRLGLPSPYYSFDAGGWHFVCLDNVARLGLSYYGMLDAPQSEWLAKDLVAAGSKTPVCVFSHIPILSACAVIDSGLYSGPGHLVPETAMQQDAIELIALLLQHNVRLCVSGHIHMVDRVEYRGITFICDGAVCGDWWNGPHHGDPPGYGVFDLFPDATFRHEYVTYDWQRPT